ncbi:MAG: UbiA family prenyltransferase [Candidatus Paceibacterota bacterium]
MLKNILLSLRPHFWILSIVPALTGAYLANNHHFSGREFLLIAILIGPCLSGIAEIVNDYADRETDELQKVKKIWKLPFSGGSGVVRVGGITKNETIVTTTLFAIVAFAIAFSINQYVVALTAIGLIIALQYSLEPIHAKIRGIFGPLFFASGFRGLVSFNIGWLTFAPFNATPLIISSAISFLFFPGFVISHLSDIEEDKKLNINTFPVQVGFENAKKISAGFFAAGLILLLTARQMGLINLNYLTLLWLPASILFLWKYFSLKNNPKDILKLATLVILILLTAPLIFI